MMATVGIVCGLQTSTLASPIASFCSGPIGTSTESICSSFSSSETHTHVDLPEAQAYETRVLGYWFTNTPGFASGFVFDQTFFLAPGDPAITAAFADASAALSAFLAPQLFSIGAPQLIANSSVLGPSVFQISQFTGSLETVTLENNIGPATIIVGDRDNGGTAFEVLSGTTNINVNTHTAKFYDDQFLATRTNRATFQITAEILDSPTATPVPEPGTLALLGAGLLGGVARRRYKQRR